MGAVVLELSVGGPGVTPSTAAASAPAPPTPTTGAVIDASLVTATVAGVDAIDRLVVYGDGRVVESSDTLSGWETVDVPVSTVERLLAEAAHRGLLEPVDFGEPGITDQGWAVARFRADGVEVDHWIYAPDHPGGLAAEQQAARVRLFEYVDFVRDTVRTDAVGPPHPYLPDELSIVAVPVAADREVDIVPASWPFDTPVRELFGDNGCAQVGIGDAERLLTVEPWSRTAAGGRIVIIATGLAVPRRLALTVGFPLPFEEACPEPDPTSTADEPHVAPWPGEDRRPADAWSHWIGWAAVEQLALSGQLGPDANSTADLSWYDASYSLADIDGRTVVDVVLTVAFGSRSDPARAAVRVDLESGDVVVFESS